MFTFSNHLKQIHRNPSICCYLQKPQFDDCLINLVVPDFRQHFHHLKSDFPRYLTEDETDSVFISRAVFNPGEISREIPDG